jgi:phosphoglycolate phosphatase
VSKSRLVLWDLDHTLLETGPAGGELFREAFEAATGVRMRGHVRPDGRTEPETFRETAVLHGVAPTDQAVAAFCVALSDGYERRREDLRTGGRLLPGAEDVLSALAERPEVLQTVVTGNIRPVALIKIGVFGLMGQLDIGIGAYGEEASTRGDLVRLASKRATDAVGPGFDGRRTVVIGDTPADIVAARTADALAVGVATGRFTPENLRAAGADEVLPDLGHLIADLPSILL